MCGRYHVSNKCVEEIEKLIIQLQGKLYTESVSALKRFAETDIHPTDEAPVLLAAGGRLDCAWLRWGFPVQRDQGKGLVINARCESAAGKPMFREGIRHRRIAIPAVGFYEWNQGRDKYFFQGKDGKPLFMAGCCRRYEDGEHFVILTTGANPSMQPVHDRMPLLLERSEAVDWILDNSRTDEILRKTPPLLERSAEYEQLSIFT